MQSSNNTLRRERRCLTNIFKLEHYKDAWILAGLTSLLMFIITSFLIESTYVSDVADDRFLAAYLAGYWTGESETQLPFIHPLYSMFISLLYRIFPNGYWYADVLVFFLFVSCVIISRCAFVLTKRSGLPVWFAFLINIAVYGVICYDQVWISFTTTPGVMCAAAAAFIACKEESKVVQRWHYSISIALITIAFLVRIETAIVGVCFCAAAVFYRFIDCFRLEKNSFRMRKLGKGFIIVLVAVALIGAVMLSQEIYEDLPENADYYEFRQACAAFYDYPHNVEDPAALRSSLGVSEELFYLIGQWFFMDPKIDADLLNALCGASSEYESGSLFVTHNNLEDAWKLIKYAMFGREEKLHYGQFTSESCRLVVYPSLLLFFSALFLLIKHRKSIWQEVFAVVCTCLGALALCVYSCFLGRFPLRVLRVIAVPCFALCLILFLQMVVIIRKYCAKTETAELWKKVKRVILIVLSLLFVVGALNSAYSVFDHSVRARNANCIYVSQCLDELAISNPDNIYFYGNALCLYNEAYPDYENGIPTNLMYWGGCYVGREPYTNQMKANGFDTLDASLFLEDNVYFLTYNYEIVYEESNLFRYLRDWYGATECTVVDSIADGLILVYSFS